MKKMVRGVSPDMSEQAARVLLERQEAYDHLIPYIQYTFPLFKPAPHHVLLAEKLEAAERGDLRRLMIFMPPRHGKTELASIRFPTWFLGRNPDRKVILSSYNEEKASEYGAQAQQIVNSPEYGRIFEGVTMSQNRRKKTAWNIEGHRGACVAVGPESSLTGRGGNLLIVDDPYKDRLMADSLHNRRKLMRWFDSVAYTRLEDNDIIIIILTRWHYDDIASTLLSRAQENPDLPAWEVLNLPAEAEAEDPLGRRVGEALWPERFPLSRLREIKANNPREYISLYQQRPSPEEGEYFRREDFQFYDVMPKRSTMRVYGTSDYSASKDASSSDYTVHCVWGIDPSNDVYLLDMFRESGKLPNEWIGELVNMIKRWKPKAWFEERGQIINSVGPFLVARMKSERVYTRRVQLSSSADKVARSRAYQGMVSMHMVYLPRNKPWIEDFLSEHTQFPGSSHDDMVDNGSLLGRALEDLRPGREFTPEDPILKPRNWTIKELIDRSGRKKRGRYVRDEAPIIGTHRNPFINHSVAAFEDGISLEFMQDNVDVVTTEDFLMEAN